MAEHVQAGLEEMLGELQQLQRVEILSPEEVKSVIKKRKHFEYKLQKRTKEKEDILSYIQYESSLLHLIGMRRDKIDYGHKKDEIDFAIARRINRLFKILEHRFSADLKIWSSHIAFLIKIGWKEQVGKVYRRCLQVHPDKADLRVSSGRYELEQALADISSEKTGKGSTDSGLRVENARTVFMEAIRFHPKNLDLYVEAFSLEVVFADWINSSSSEDGGHLVPDETIEAVKEGKIAETVFLDGWDKACACKDDKQKFGLNCLKVALDLQAPLPLLNSIKRCLEEDSEVGKDSPGVWEGLALSHLHQSKWRARSQMEKISLCCQVYERGLTQEMTLPTTKQVLLASYVKALKDMLSRFNLSKEVQNFLSKRLWMALLFGNEHHILNLEQETMFTELNKDLNQI